MDKDLNYHEVSDFFPIRIGVFALLSETLLFYGFFSLLCSDKSGDFLVFIGIFELQRVCFINIKSTSR